MGLFSHVKSRKTVRLVAVICLGLAWPARAELKHTAATIDDTGSIFDETPGSAPTNPPPPPVKPSPPPVKVTPPVKDPTTENPVIPVKPPPPLKPPVVVVPKEVDPVPAAPKRPAKLPVPDGKTQAASLKLVRELFATEYGKTATTDIHALALRLFDQSRETTDDPAARYVLLSEATDRAAAGGDAALAMRAVRVIVRGYRVDGPAAALAALSNAIKAKGATAEAFSTCARTALDFSREALAANDLTTAGAAADIAVTASLRTRDGSLAKVVKQNADRVAELRKGFEAVKDATARLKTAPNNLEDCLAVGKYRCFVRGDWPSGLRLLSRGSDAGLKTLAAKDVTLREESSSTDIPIDPDAAAAMADAWWAAAESAAADPELQKAAQTRACYWYARAASEMGGMARARLENRLNDVRAARLKPGLVGHYFNSHRFDHQVMERVDPQINFAWGNGSPGTGVNADSFAAWWSGYIKAPALGKTKVIISVDDACAIWLDGKLILNEWHNAPQGTYNIDVDFTGRPQNILMYFGEVNGNASMGLGWIPRSAKKVLPIPASAFFHDPDPSQRIPLPRPKGTVMFGGHSYAVITQHGAWTATKDLCEQMGGHLVIIETPEEQKFINDLVGDMECWIGLSDDEEEGVWRWVNGRQAQYLGWVETEPQGGEGENFGMTYHGGWADVGQKDLGCVCEWDD